MEFWTNIRKKHKKGCFLALKEPPGHTQELSWSTDKQNYVASNQFQLFSKCHQNPRRQFFAKCTKVSLFWGLFDPKKPPWGTPQGYHGKIKSSKVSLQGTSYWCKISKNSCAWFWRYTGPGGRTNRTEFQGPIPPSPGNQKADQSR